MFEISSARQACNRGARSAAITATRSWLVTGLVCLAAALASCASDADDLDSVPVGVTRDALSGLVIAGWGGVGGSGTAFANGSPYILPLGVGSGWVCWLSGVRGTLGEGGDFDVFNVGSDADPVDKLSANEWALDVRPAPGQSAFGNAVCAPASFLGEGILGVNSPTLLTGATSSDWCGLNDINTFPAAVAGLPHQPWTQSGDFATVSNNGSNPQIKSGAPTWTLSGSFNNTTSANCAQASVSGTWNYHIVAPSSGTGSFNMLQSDGSQLPSGTVCFLTNLQGAFVNSGFTDGVFVDRSSSGMWSMTASNGKSGWALCIL